ncbi:MAG: glycosyltransferase family 9 protein [bacterium]
MDKILISRTDGIGDLLLTTPLIKEVKAKYPAVKITVLVSQYANDLLLNNPNVYSTIIYDKKRPDLLLSKLKTEKFDTVIAAYPRPELAWYFFKTGIPQRYGTASRWYSFLYNQKVAMSRKKSEKSEADYNLMTAGKLLDNVTAVKEYYFITEKEKQNGLEYIKQKGIGSGFIIIHPGSKGSAWNLSEVVYSKLADEILEDGYHILLTGGKTEKDLLNKIKNNMTQKNNIFIMNEELTMRQFAGVIAQAEVLISSSTGPMHIAAALGVKTLSFFPPDTIASMKPKRWACLGNKQVIIQPKNNNPKPQDMDLIDRKIILSKLKELINR